MLVRTSGGVIPLLKETLASLCTSRNCCRCLPLGTSSASGPDSNTTSLVKTWPGVGYGVVRPRPRPRPRPLVVAVCGLNSGPMFLRAELTVLVVVRAFVAVFVAAVFVTAVFVADVFVADELPVDLKRRSTSLFTCG